MISADYLRSIAVWSHDLTEPEFVRAQKNIIERSYPKGGYVCHRGDKFDYWTGLASGLMKLGIVTKSGKAVTLGGLAPGAWFGEGSILKDEARQYDLVALRESKLALMDRATFLWLYENSGGFNRYLVRQFNERLGQFIGSLEYDRSLDPPARLARCIAWLFHPILCPGAGSHQEISQEELGLLSGMSRQMANQSLKVLEERGLVRLERGGITVLNLAKLRRTGG